MRNSQKKSPLASVRKQSDFKRAFKAKKSAATPLFVVYAAANGFGYNRLGLSVSKKIGNAVVRNRVKRLARESCRLIFAQENMGHACGFDLIVIARAPAGVLPRETAFVEVNEALISLFKRLGVL